MKTKARRKPKSILLFGRRWLNRRTGNTYHSVQVFLNGMSVFYSKPCYGYGQQYEWTAREWLRERGSLPGLGEHQSLWRWCEKNGVTFSSESVDVLRERDL